MNVKCHYVISLPRYLGDIVLWYIKVSPDDRQGKFGTRLFKVFLSTWGTLILLILSLILKLTDSDGVINVSNLGGT